MRLACARARTMFYVACRNKLDMRIRTYILIGLLSFCGVGLFYASDAEAKTCKLEGGLTGECRKSCNADELSNLQLTVINLDEYAQYGGLGCAQDEGCCVKKGSGLCSDVTTNSSAISADLVGKFSCAAKCAAGPAVELVKLETCSGSDVCCANPAPASAAAKASAAAPAASQNIKLKNPLDPQNTGVTFYTLIQKVISAFLGLVGGLALAVFVYAGILWMTAGGDDKKVQTSKDAMKYAVMGLAMIMFAYAITSFLIDALTGSIASQQAQEVEYAEQQNLGG